MTSTAADGAPNQLMAFLLMIRGWLHAAVEQFKRALETIVAAIEMAMFIAAIWAAA